MDELIAESRMNEIDEYIANDPLLVAMTEIFHYFITGELPEGYDSCPLCGQPNNGCICKPETCEECYWFIPTLHLGLCTCEESRCHGQERFLDARACSKAIFHWEGQLAETGRVGGQAAE